MMNRRRFLTTTVAASTLGIAGCLGGDNGGDDSPDGNGNDSSDGNGDDSPDGNDDDSPDGNGDDSPDGNGNDDNGTDDNGNDGGEEPLQASFTIAPNFPEPGEEVTFDASGSLGDIAEFRWDFTDDGEFEETTADSVVTHTFEEETATMVTLEIAGGDGETATESAELLVSADEDGLSAAFNWEPQEPSPAEEVTFTPNRLEGDIAEFRWDFDDDGEFEETTDEPTEVTHAFESTGPTPVTLEVEGSDGGTSSTTRDVEVGSSGGGPDLAATFETSPKNPDPGEEVLFDVISVAGDPIEYRWDLDGDQEFEETRERAESVTYTYEEPGTYLAQLVVEDSDGNTSSTLGEVVVGDPTDDSSA